MAGSPGSPDAPGDRVVGRGRGLVDVLLEPRVELGSSHGMDFERHQAVA